MEIGTKLDPIALGFQAIDIKGLIQECGYVMPQGSVAKLPKLPAEVEVEIAKQKASQEAYETLEDFKVFHCPYCDTKNISNWKKEVATGTEFLVCGNCNSVVEVR